MDDGKPTPPTVQVEISKELVDQAQALGVDVARVAEHALRRHTREARRDMMTDDERQEQIRQINAEIEWRNKQIDEHGLFGQEWRPL